MKVVSDLDIFLLEMKDCPYYQSLSSRPLELRFKYPPSSCPISEIKRGTHALNEKEMIDATDILFQRILPKLWSWLPELQSTNPIDSINILWVTSDEYVSIALVLWMRHDVHSFVWIVY